MQRGLDIFSDVASSCLHNRKGNEGMSSVLKEELTPSGKIGFQPAYLIVMIFKTFIPN